MNEGAPAALDQRLKHELGNALMVVLTYAQVIDRRAPEDPVIHDAVARIRGAVSRSQTSVDEVVRELREIAGRLSSSG